MKLVLNTSRKTNFVIMEKMHFPVIVELDEDRIFIVSCPMFKGYHSAGKSISEALDNLKEVIEICIEEQRLDELNQFIGLRDIEVQIPASA